MDSGGTDISQEIENLTAAEINNTQTENKESEESRKKVTIVTPKSSRKLWKSITPDIRFLGRQFEFEHMSKLGNVITRLKVDQRKTDKRREQRNKYLKSYLKYLRKIADRKYIFETGNDKFKEEVGNELATSGAVTVLCDVVVDIYKLGYFSNKDLIENNFVALQYSLTALMNFSSVYQECTNVICEHECFLDKTAKYLQRLNNEISKQDMLVTISIFIIIHNLTMFKNNISKLRQFNFVEIVSPFLSSEIASLKLITAAILAEIVTEEESELFIHQSPDILGFLLEALQSACKLDSRIHPSLNWPAWKLLRVVRVISRHDKIKKELFDRGSLPLFVGIAKTGEIQEQREAFKTIRSLSFNENVKQEMLTDVCLGVVSLLTSSRENSDSSIAESATYALLSLNENFIKGTGGIETRPTECQVMMSFDYTDRKLVRKIRHRLQSQELNVWVDKHRQTTNISDVLRAVDKARVILMCISKNYKESENCRAIIEYAYRKEKTLIPLLLHEYYEVEGWVGKIAGERRAYRLPGEMLNDLDIASLIKDIKDAINQTEPEKSELPEEIIDAISVNPPEYLRHRSEQVQLCSTFNETQTLLDNDLKDWTSEHIDQWLDKHKLNRSKFGHLKGKEIAYLKLLLEKSLENYNKILNEQLKIKDLTTVAAFTFALSDTTMCSDSSA